ncbi:regulator of chromosome condensation 1/beta-lactamase-inhibitor protein II [Rhodocollybia butyracea]|uniref:Regulator of chromosome condensation 1/beta-lactamase-inhibitor protein II n=1 Tax=Rhodocollybia butyracea TaxID=206335 RepID=A0A9P5UBA8_9AGAR|nr:regulator of chromosome condensation 1/beta-lactamase-inhibitor protein II [Rhodocollybia butyracea]
MRNHLWACGDGAFGQRGNCEMNSHDQVVFRRVDLNLTEKGLVGYQPRLICSAWETSYVVLSCDEKGSDVLISMGSNDFGDLGVGQTVRAELYHTVAFDHLRVDGLALDLVKVISMTAGQHHIIAHVNVRLHDQSHRNLLVGWGAARHGQLGGDTSMLNKKTPYFCIPKIIETFYSDDPVIAVALGSQHSIFRHESGRLSCLGSNKKAQTTGLDMFRQVSVVGCTWNGSYFLDSGTLYATGSHSKGQLGRSLLPDSPSSSIQPHPVELPFNTKPSPDSNVFGIACGSEHVIALRADCSPPEVWGWGWNEHGNMGLGSTMDILMPSKLWPLETSMRIGLPVGIWAGCGTSWIALEEQRR